MPQQRMHHQGRSRRQPPARPARAVHTESDDDGERNPEREHGSWHERLSSTVARWTGSAAAQVAAFLLVVVWLASGPVFHYSDTWQLVINTGTTIITFLMVFTIQRAQNKESAATALRLSEIIAALEGASNRMIDVGDLTEAEQRALQEHYRELVALAKRDAVLTKSHSIEEARARHARKLPRRGGAT